MSEERTMKKVFKNILEGKQSVGRPRKVEWMMVKMIWWRRLEENSYVIQTP